MQNQNKEPVIFYYPAKIDNNEYVNKILSILTSLHLNPKEVEFSVNQLLSIFSLRFRKVPVVFILNWLEDIPTQVSRFAYLRLCIVAILMLVYKAIGVKFIWVKHNFKPHSGRANVAFSLLVKLLNIISNEKVSHRELSGFHYLPHPTYPFSGLVKERDIEFLIFGTVQRYKEIELLLSAWPKDKKIFIIGNCKDEAYEIEISSIIKSRNLLVERIPGFINYDELNSYIVRSKYVLISSSTDNMVVSGVFFHAASLGANIIIKNSEFGEWVKNKFNFITIFKLNEILNGVLDKIKYIDANEVSRSLSKECSDELIGIKFRSIIEKALS